MGLGVNKEKAFQLLRLSAENGHAKGQTAVGWGYLYGWGVKGNLSQAVVWFQEGARQDAFAQAELGKLYFDGLGVEKDEKLGNYWKSKAYEEDDFPYGKNIDTKSDCGRLCLRSGTKDSVIFGHPW